MSESLRRELGGGKDLSLSPVTVDKGAILPLTKITEEVTIQVKGRAIAGPAAVSIYDLMQLKKKGKKR